MVNEGVEKLDPSGIVAGQSDRLDVLKQLGVPPEQNVEESAFVRSAGTIWLPGLRRRCFRIGFDQILLITPFRWCFSDYPYRLAVEFDENGIVKWGLRQRAAI